eukprot:jgi/Chlat1/1260/Chrsp115S00758
MGKKQHSKDRMYITKTEWATEWGGHKNKARLPFQRLPFYCCALSFTPFEDAVCTADGTVFEILNIVPYIQKFKKHPVTGAPLKVQDLIKLNFHKNSDGEYHCPVLHKVFTEFTHIVAVRTTGNVYCYEAIQQLCLKTKNFKDLLTDEPFIKADIITLQDPNNLETRVISKFDHVEKGLEVEDEEAEKLRNDPAYNIRTSEDMKRVIQALGTQDAAAIAAHGGGGKAAEAERRAALALAEERTRRATEGEEAEPAPKPIPQSITDIAAATAGRGQQDKIRAMSNEKAAARLAAAAVDQAAAAQAAAAAASASKTVKQRYTTGAVSRSFTSTACDVATQNNLAELKVEKTPTKKGYVRLHTTHGDINVELHCDIVPRTCENFLTLCEAGYYDGVVFHRSIKNFMIQGGDPTGTGTGGESMWKRPFKDELNSKLTHSGRGVLSMANSGPHSNGSQFFILYKSAKHLDYKHTVFGRVVGQMDTLSTMEKVPVDKNDKPSEEIKIESVTVFVNPYTEEEEAEEPATTAAPASDAADEERGQWYSNPAPAHNVQPVRAGIGKYIGSTTSQASASRPSADEGAPAAKKAKTTPAKTAWNFSSW